MDDIKNELRGEGLRLASSDEAGWYYLTENFGKVWVTDIQIDES